MLKSVQIRLSRNSLMKLYERYQCWKRNCHHNRTISQTCIDKSLLMTSVWAVVPLERTPRKTFLQRRNNAKEVCLDSKAGSSKILLFLVERERVALPNRFKKLKEFPGLHKWAVINHPSNDRNQEVILKIDLILQKRQTLAKWKKPMIIDTAFLNPSFKKVSHHRQRTWTVIGGLQLKKKTFRFHGLVLQIRTLIQFHLALKNNWSQ